MTMRGKAKGHCVNYCSSVSEYHVKVVLVLWQMPMPFLCLFYLYMKNTDSYLASWIFLRNTEQIFTCCIIHKNWDGTIFLNPSSYLYYMSVDNLAMQRVMASVCLYIAKYKLIWWNEMQIYEHNHKSPGWYQWIRSATPAGRDGGQVDYHQFGD